jgi:hypothetical protein
MYNAYYTYAMKFSMMQTKIDYLFILKSWLEYTYTLVQCVQACYYQHYAIGTFKTRSSLLEQISFIAFPISPPSTSTIKFFFG